MVDKVNAIVLAGGSAFGLEAATGTVRWLEEHNIGWPAGPSKVPIVPAAILFDLGVGGNAKVRPTADCGYKAADAATIGPVQEGTVGAGAGATVGKLGGIAEHTGYPGGRRLPTTATRARSTRRTRAATATRSSRSPPDAGAAMPTSPSSARSRPRRWRRRSCARRRRQPAFRTSPPRAI